MTARRFAFLDAAMFVALMVVCLVCGCGLPEEEFTTKAPRHKEESGEARVWRTVASWYGKPGDRWAGRYPAACYLGWPLTVGEFWPGVAFNALPLYSVVRVTCAATGRSILALVVDRIGRENPASVRARIDLTWSGFRRLADPRQGLVDVEIAEVRP